MLTWLSGILERTALQVLIKYRPKLRMENLVISYAGLFQCCPFQKYIDEVI